MGVACQLASWPRKAAESRFFFYSGVEQNHTTCFPAEAVGPWKICRPYTRLIVCSRMGYFYIHTNPQGAEGQETRSLEFVWFCCWLASFLPKLWVQTGGGERMEMPKLRKRVWLLKEPGRAQEWGVSSHRQEELTNFSEPPHLLPCTVFTRLRA